MVAEARSRCCWLLPEGNLPPLILFVSKVSLPVKGIIDFIKDRANVTVDPRSRLPISFFSITVSFIYIYIYVL